MYDFTALVKHVAALLYACDVMQPDSALGVHRTTQHCSSPKQPHQFTMLGCMKAEYFRLAKDVTAIYALFREGMHEKELIWACFLRKHEHMCLLAT